MKNNENIRKLLHTMNDFAAAYDCLRSEIEKYERETNTSINDLPGFTGSYPFDKSFDELPIDAWVHHTVESLKQVSFKVLNYEYLNTGGGCMVGIHEVWLPAKNQTVYVFTNEEGYTMSTVDYIRNELDVDDYDECMLEYGDWGRVTGHETYFELYRHCLNEYTKSDCQAFKQTRELPYYLLSDELQSKVTTEYRQWLEAEGIDTIETNGEDIIEREIYVVIVDDEKVLKPIREFQRWHDSIAADEKYYDCDYTLTFADKKITLPFVADVWDAVDHMLTNIIENY
jgi:hypothetical protein